MKKSVFDRNDVQIEEKTTAYDGFFRIEKYRLHHPLFAGGESTSYTRELFCRGSSVAVLLYDPEKDRVGLTCQFRIGCLDNPAGPWVWEVVAGVTNGEDPVSVAMQEVAEESGLVLQPGDLRKICSYYSSPGGSDECLTLYCGLLDLPEIPAIKGLEAENEDILFQSFAYDEAINAMLDGTINNAATVIALQWLQLNRDGLRGRPKV